MAVRTGAGTGVVVSLVVFVLTTVFLLVLAIVFYAGQVKEREAKVASDSALADYVKPRQRSNDLYQEYETFAKQNNMSVAEYLHDRHATLMRFVDGDPGTKVTDLKERLVRFGVEGDDVLRDVLIDKERRAASLQNEVDSLKSQLVDQQGLTAEKEAVLRQTLESHRQELDAVQGQIGEYREAAERYRQTVDETIADLERAKDRNKDEYGQRIGELEGENDELRRERVVISDRLKELERIIAQDRIGAKHPAMLVDGRILDSAGPQNQIFIDRGKNDRIVLGMTFEVYDDAASIRVNERTGELPRGKASIQVIKVGETTSTCKITRTVPGRPVVRDDVIANAVYDPDYQFKFLVHGKFDVDNDKRPSEAEAEYLRSLVIDWGGVVVTGEELPGDLDFLVLGVEPPRGNILPSNPTEVQINEYIRRRRALEKYNELFNQAREAQIPVLNANRFFVLIGHTDR